MITAKVIGYHKGDICRHNKSVICQEGWCSKCWLNTAVRELLEKELTLVNQGTLKYEN